MIATSSGLTRWDGRVFRNYYRQDGLRYGYVRVLATDRNGDILASTDRGVSRVHDDRIVPDRLQSVVRGAALISLSPSGIQR